MKAPSFAFFFLLLLLTATVPAHSTWRGYAGPRPAHHEISLYVAQNVLPVVRQQGQKLENQLSTADKAQLAIYRTQLRELRQQGQALRQRFTGAGTAPEARPELTEAQKQQLQQLHTEKKALLQSVEQLALKYQGDIVRLSKEIQPQKEQWQADIKALALKSADQQQHTGQLAGKKQHNGSIARLFRPALFLLLDPTSPAVPAPAQTQPRPTAVYPNPAASSTQLTYHVVKPGPVTVELLDGRGNTLRTVAQEDRQEKGPYTVQADVADLPAGTYFYKITTKSGAETRRFVKE